jgi:hypothetical protein
VAAEEQLVADALARVTSQQSRRHHARQVLRDVRRILRRARKMHLVDDLVDLGCSGVAQALVQLEQEVHREIARMLREED